MSKRLLMCWILAGILVVATGVVWLIIFYKQSSNELKVSFLDVGQGDAIFIEAPNGNQVLIDAGSGRQVLRALGKAMPFYDRQIDLVIATHADADHIGGLGSVFERFEVLGIMDNGLVEDSEDYNYFANKAKAETNIRLVARVGQKITLDKGVELEILFPEKDMRGSEANTASIVARLIYGKTSFLLTGDSPSVIEDRLVQRYRKNISANVLKLGHHGSNTSSSNYFLSAVDPDIAIVSAGRDNRYGHPHQEVLDRLGLLNIPYLNTAQQGNIVFKSDGQRVLCTNC